MAPIAFRVALRFASFLRLRPAAEAVHPEALEQRHWALEGVRSSRGLRSDVLKTKKQLLEVRSEGRWASDVGLQVALNMELMVGALETWPVDQATAHGQVVGTTREEGHMIFSLVCEVTRPQNLRRRRRQSCGSGGCRRRIGALRSHGLDGSLRFIKSSFLLETAAWQISRETRDDRRAA